MRPERRILAPDPSPAILQLHPATSAADWQAAALLLTAVAGRLEHMQMPLWTNAQISVQGLQDQYALEQLHFFTRGAARVGLVFLMDDDPLFWPELPRGTSLFFHKLALDPDLQGQGLGGAALALLDAHAARARLQWLRLDCDDRAPLHRFYAENGFSLVDSKRVEPFSVCRYQRRVRTVTGRQEPPCMS